MVQLFTGKIVVYRLTGSYAYTCILLVIVGGEEESHGKSLDTFNLPDMCLPIRDRVAHLFIILFDADFLALWFIFFPRSLFKNSNCHAYNVFPLVLEGLLLVLEEISVRITNGPQKNDWYGCLCELCTLQKKSQESTKQL